jgi:hypothetical protein
MGKSETTPMSNSKKKQRMLQLAMGVLLIVIVILVEMVAVTPKGIYSYTADGVGPFEINSDRATVLKEINRIRAVRQLETCSPDSRILLESRKGFGMTEQMADATNWRCLDRKKGLYIFYFDPDQDRLVRIIHLNDLPDPDNPFDLFSRCIKTEKNKDPDRDPSISQDLDHFLETQTRYPVHYH